MNPYDMTREKKIRLLKQIEIGLVSIEDLKDKSDQSAVVIYTGKIADVDADDKTFRFTGSSEVMNKKEIYEACKNIKTILFLPDKVKI